MSTFGLDGCPILESQAKSMKTCEVLFAIIFSFGLWNPGRAHCRHTALSDNDRAYVSEQSVGTVPRTLTWTISLVLPNRQPDPFCR